jgi:YVTN family beta-propeller protein
MMMRTFALMIAWLSLVAVTSARAAVEPYVVCVSNERDGTVTFVDGATDRVIDTLAVGQRPRGIHASPDGRWLYIALSGTPIAGPPKKDASGKPIRDDDDEREADHAQDGIAAVDVASRKLVKKLPAGTDPEQFAVNPDGTRLFIANEDAGLATVLNIATEKVEQAIPVEIEPEGVGISPNGQWVYVTCEGEGDVVVIDTAARKVVAEFRVGGRPRSASFLPDSSRAFVPSETLGKLHVIDTRGHKLVRSIELPKGSLPMDTKVSRDGRHLFVSNGRGGTVSIIDTATFAILKTIPVGTRAWGIALSPDDRFLYVANGPSNDISKVDVSAGAEVKRIAAGASPWAVAVIASRPPAQANVR